MDKETIKLPVQVNSEIIGAIRDSRLCKCEDNDRFIENLGFFVLAYSAVVEHFQSLESNG